ncbi:MAG TPA: hypothetical protein GX516_10545 [Thermoanaerobacter sp.]|nr:hypothetical protein [Thermoanaerobacter sp.]
MIIVKYKKKITDFFKRNSNPDKNHKYGSNKAIKRQDNQDSPQDNHYSTSETDMLNKFEHCSVPPSLGLGGMIIGLGLLAAVFLRVHIYYSVSFIDFLLSFINPDNVYEIIGNEIFIYLLMIWIGWAFVTDGAIGTIRDKIARKTLQKQTFLLIEAVIQVLLPFLNFLVIGREKFFLFLLLVSFLIFWYQLFVRTIFSFIP